MIVMSMLCPFPFPPATLPRPPSGGANTVRA
jgi:hypothetical protein